MAAPVACIRVLCPEIISWLGLVCTVGSGKTKTETGAGALLQLPMLATTKYCASAVSGGVLKLAPAAKGNWFRFWYQLNSDSGLPLAISVVVWLGQMLSGRAEGVAGVSRKVMVVVSVAGGQLFPLTVQAKL